MTLEEYVALGATIHALLVEQIEGDAPAAVVWDRDPVNFDLAAWHGALVSDNSLDAEGEKRAHAYIVTFAASDDLDSSTTRSIEPTFRYRVQVWYAHDFGTDEANSEKEIRAEVLKVQYGLATMPKPANVQNRALLPIRLRLADMGGRVLHRGEGEISFELAPIRTH